MQTTAAAETSFPLLTHVDGLVAGLTAQIPKALNDWDVEGIHQSRVATRRLKAAIDLMRPVLTKRSRRPFARVMRRLRRRLGPLRDADVMIAHLDELAAESREHAPAVDWLRRRLWGERERLREASRREGPAAAVLERLGAWWHLRDEFVEARAAVPSLLAESLHLQTDAFAEQADRLVADMRAVQSDAGSSERGTSDAPAKGAAGEAPARQDPHELRISGKALRYTLEMAMVEGHDLPGSVTKDFKRMQESLGLWHDYVVLAERTLRAALDDLTAHHDVALQERILELARYALRTAAGHLERFAELWTGRGVELASTIRAQFPLTKPLDASQSDGAATESQTGPDPRGSGETSGPSDCLPAAASDA